MGSGFIDFLYYSCYNIIMKHVIVAHGLFMKSPVMMYIGHHLKKEGYKVHFFNYQTLHFNRKRTLSRLKEMTEGLEEVYFVGHSMGGLVLREFIQEYSSKNYQALVTLGTPHKCSEFARIVSKSDLNDLLGINTHSGLISDLKDYGGKPPLGSIAGNKARGLFEWYSDLSGNELEEENDGTVLVKETLDVNFTDHIVLPESHTGLLYSNKVMKQILYFFDHKVFCHNKN